MGEHDVAGGALHGLREPAPGNHERRQVEVTGQWAQRRAQTPRPRRERRHMRAARHRRRRVQAELEHLAVQAQLMLVHGAPGPTGGQVVHERDAQR